MHYVILRDDDTCTYTPAAFGTYMAAEIDKWGKVVKASGARPE